MSQKEKNLTITEHGVFLYGKLDGIDLVESGKGINDVGKDFTYGSSLKLRFIINVKSIKTIQGTEVSTLVPKIQLVSISLPDDRLIAEFNKFSFLVGKDLLVPSSLNVKEDKVIKIINVSQIVEV